MQGIQFETVDLKTVYGIGLPVTPSRSSIKLIAGMTSKHVWQIAFYSMTTD